MPVMISVNRSVSVCGEARKAGSSVPSAAAMPPAVEVTM